MTAIKKRRLHVWEHPSLHPEQAKLKGRVPVHVIFEDHEYDVYRVLHDGQLAIGMCFARMHNGVESFDEMYFYRVSSGMYAKVWEEHYEELPVEPEQTPLFDLEQPDPRQDDPGFVGRERFENLPYPAEETDEPTDKPKDDHTVIMPAVKPDRVDGGTGLNLTHIANQIDPPLPPLPAVPANDETRLDLHSPLLLMKTLEPATNNSDSE